eukprot:6209891-Pleurochrysis_carterae.AAC.3
MISVAHRAALPEVRLSAVIWQHVETGDYRGFYDQGCYCTVSKTATLHEPINVHSLELNMQGRSTTAHTVA